VKKTGPSRKAIIGWTAFMLAGLALAYFIGAVVAPVWKTRATIRQAREDRDPDARGDFLRTVLPGCPGAEARVSDLGGQERALDCLRLYLRLPTPIAPDKCYAVLLLGHCGDSAVPLLSELLHDQKAQVRNCATAALWRVGPRAKGVLPLLREALRDSHSSVGDSAALAFRNMAQEYPEALCELVDALEDENARARYRAVKTLGGLNCPSKSVAVLPILERLAEGDDSPIVRQAASDAVKKTQAAEQ